MPPASARAFDPVQGAPYLLPLVLHLPLEVIQLLLALLADFFPASQQLLADVGLVWERQTLTSVVLPPRIERDVLLSALAQRQQRPWKSEVRSHGLSGRLNLSP
jgi:hypothetical protein